MSQTPNGTPRADGFRMPAEWEPHEQCWLIWPENGYAWREGARPAQRALAELANAIAETGEQVTVTATGPAYPHARTLLSDRVRLLTMDVVLGWARDIAPTFVVDDEGRRRAVAWRFNGYGQLYPHWQRDSQYAFKVMDAERTAGYVAPLVVEGGGFHVDGEGTCLVTAETLLDPARNPGLGTDAIDAELGRYLGADTVIWLERGLTHDETKGHIDNMACFTAPGEVCLSWTDDESDPQYERGAEALARLESATDARGRSLTVHKLPLPGPLSSTEEEDRTVDQIVPRPYGGHRLPASYTNFYVANGHVFAPLLDPERDDEAHKILGELFADREVVGLATRELLLGGGNIHCATQQIPMPRVRGEA
ncbi:MAG TPA: agmatine deiminase [Stackebrandtia sp.]|jgi:agmatine deiminase|uniref:agmatine deiminase n=1 Tax=Stackebrandtia sp. TaxID=2023065 RepID=UPI002D4B87FE|nr:agmatine deiminase [Stackebrandtia sp.]HZE38668.1 agmatine deiminase [Stackebrandtia sp.]